MPIINHANRDEWLQARKGYITASDAAIICSEIPTPYKDPVTLWAEKLGLREPDPPNDLMKAGLIKEPHIAEVYEELYGERLHNPGDYAIHVHPRIPWLAATIDRSIYDPAIPFEIKNISEFNKEYQQEDRAQLAHECQLQVQMFVMGADKGILFCEIGGNRWLKREYARNDKFLNGLMPQLEAFHECLISETEPEYDWWSHSVTKTFEILHPNDNGQKVYIDELESEAREYQELLEARLSLTKQAKANEAREKELAIKLKAAIGDNTYGDAGSVRFALKTRKDKQRQLKIVE